MLAPDSTQEQICRHPIPMESSVGIGFVSTALN